MYRRSKRSSSSWQDLESSDSSSTLIGDIEKKTPRGNSKKGQQRYDLSSEDGFDARNIGLKTFEDRRKALKDDKTIFNYNPNDTETMYVFPMSTPRWAFRVFWNILMLGGFITGIYQSLVTNFKWVITLIFSSLLLNFKDYINDWWDDVPPANRREYHWAATTIALLLFTFMLRCLVFIEWVWDTGVFETQDSLERRLRRRRFKYLHDEQVKIDPFCRDFTMIYNDEFDPDIAASVYRKNTDNLPWMLWLFQPDDLYIQL